MFHKHFLKVGYYLILLQMTTLYHGNQQEAAAEVASRLEERVATLGLWLVLCSPGQVAELLRRFQPQSLCTHAS